VGDAEVRHLHRAVREQEDVCGLDVAMDHALPVRILERGEICVMIRSMSAGRKRSLGCERVLELAAVDVFHRDEPRAVVLVAVVDRDDVRMGQTPAACASRAEARDDVLRALAGQVGRADRLQRDRRLIIGSYAS
jgi:hypothetical protein